MGRRVTVLVWAGGELLDAAVTDNVEAACLMAFSWSTCSEVSRIDVYPPLEIEDVAL